MPHASKGGHAVQRRALQTTAGALDRDLANARMSTQLFALPPSRGALCLLMAASTPGGGEVLHVDREVLLLPELARLLCPVSDAGAGPIGPRLPQSSALPPT